MPPWFFELSPEQQAAVGGHQGMATVRKPYLWSRFYIKTNVLPRQARAKRRKNSQKEAFFL
jgi:hypothetical protein